MKKKSSGLDAAIMNLFYQISPTLTLLMEDGSKVITPIRREFLLTNYNRKKNVSQIKNDLFAIKHDRNAVDFRI